MGIFVDIAIIVIIATTVGLGYKKGLIGALFNICSFFLSLLIAFLLVTPVSNFIINNTTIDTNLQQVITQKLGGGDAKEEQETSRGYYRIFQ